MKYVLIRVIRGLIPCPSVVKSFYGEIVMRFGMDYGGTNIKTGLFSDDGQVVEFK